MLTGNPKAKCSVVDKYHLQTPSFLAVNTHTAIVKVREGPQKSKNLLIVFNQSTNTVIYEREGFSFLTLL